MLTWVRWFLMKEFQTFLFLAMSFSAFLSLRLLQITSFLVFQGRHLGELLLTLKFLYLLEQAFSFILSGWLNHCSLLSCKHSFIPPLSLVLSSSSGIISSCLTLHVNLIILASFFSRVITSSLTGQALLLCSIMLCTHAEYYLSFAPNSSS